MNHMYVLLFATFFLSTLLVLAGEVTQTGTLLDAMCGEKGAANAEKVASHKVICAKMDNCKESGFGIVSDGKFLKFDKAGDEKAWAVLEKTSKTHDLQVTVTGALEGNTLKVTKIEEVK